MPDIITKIHQIHDSDIFPLKIRIPDKNNLFATLELVKSSQDWSSQARSGQVKSGLVKSSQDWSSKFGSNFKSGQVKSSWDRLNQVMTGQVKLGLVKSDRSN